MKDSEAIDLLRDGYQTIMKSRHRSLPDEIAHEIDRFVVIDEQQRDTVVLWVLHCWTIGAHFTTPRLLITSPERECGKSVLLDVIREMVREPVSALNISGAALVRSLATEPTVLIDELDQTLTQKSERVQDVMGVLNTGYRRGNKVRKMEARGRDFEARDFETFAPIVFSGIESKMDGPFMSRTIPIRMERALPEERWTITRRLAEHYEQLREDCQVWAAKSLVRISDAEPDLMPGLEGRAAELWIPLLNVADELGGDWPARSRKACELLTLWNPPEDTSPAHRVLEACQHVWEGDEEQLTCQVLCERLNRLDDEDFDSWNRGKGLTPRTVGLNLAKYNIHAVPRKVEGNSVKVYKKDAYEAAWARYCPEKSPEPLTFFSSPSPPSKVVRAGEKASPATSSNPQTTDNLKVVTDEPKVTTRDAKVEVVDSSVENGDSPVADTFELDDPLEHVDVCELFVLRYVVR